MTIGILGIIAVSLMSLNLVLTAIHASSNSKRTQYTVTVIQIFTHYAVAILLALLTVIADAFIKTIWLIFLSAMFSAIGTAKYFAVVDEKKKRAKSKEIRKAQEFIQELENKQNNARRCFILSYNKDKMYDVIQSLKRLINDCKDDSQISPAMADLCINRLPEFIKIYDQYVEKMKKNNNKKHIEEMAECSKKFLQYIQQVEVAQENLLKDNVDAFKTTLENNADTLNNSI